MKKLLLILLLIIPFVGFGQINTTTTKYVIPEDKSLGNSWYRFTVEEKTKDNEKYYYVTFQNNEYQELIDMKIIGFYSFNELEEFITDLDQLCNYGKLKEDQDIDIRKPKYLIQRNGGKSYSQKNDVYIWRLDENGNLDGYTTFVIKSFNKKIKRFFNDYKNNL